MFGRPPGVPELLIILGILVLVLGVGRLGRIGGELGSAIRNFREGLTGGEKKDETAEPPADKPTDQS